MSRSRKDTASFEARNREGRSAGSSTASPSEEPRRHNPWRWLNRRAVAPTKHDSDQQGHNDSSLNFRPAGPSHPSPQDGNSSRPISGSRSTDNDAANTRNLLAELRVSSLTTERLQADRDLSAAPQSSSHPSRAESSTSVRRARTQLKDVRGDTLQTLNDNVQGGSPRAYRLCRSGSTSGQTLMPAALTPRQSRRGPPATSSRDTHIPTRSSAGLVDAVNASPTPRAPTGSAHSPFGQSPPLVPAAATTGIGGQQRRSGEQTGQEPRAPSTEIGSIALASAGRSIRLRLETDLRMHGHDTSPRIRESGNVPTLAQIDARYTVFQQLQKQGFLRQRVSGNDYIEWSGVANTGKFSADWLVSGYLCEHIMTLFALLGRIHLSTPDLSIIPQSPWRHCIKEAWRKLEARFPVSEDDQCFSRIHISYDPDYNVKDLKRIASSVIYFESAFEALTPERVRYKTQIKSNWLDGPGLGRAGKSRQESIDAIRKASRRVEVIDLMQQPGDERYAWNFLRSNEPTGAIQFRKLPPFVTAESALAWSELAFGFIQAAILCGSSRQLPSYEPTIRGLRSFIEQVQVPGVSQPQKMHYLWRGHSSPYGAAEPIRP